MIDALKNLNQAEHEILAAGILHGCKNVIDPSNETQALVVGVTEQSAVAYVRQTLNMRNNVPLPENIQVVGIDSESSVADAPKFIRRTCLVVVLPEVAHVNSRSVLNLGELAWLLVKGNAAVKWFYTFAVRDILIAAYLVQACDQLGIKIKDDVKEMPETFEFDHIAASKYRPGDHDSKQPAELLNGCEMLSKSELTSAVNNIRKNYAHIYVSKSLACKIFLT